MNYLNIGIKSRSTIIIIISSIITNSTTNGQKCRLKRFCYKALKVTVSTTEFVDPSMGLRLKREDCKRTKHDSSFSQWKILIGSSDWQDHLLGKEGAEKYRTQNLPNCTFPGVYELGIATLRLQSGQKSRLLASGQVIPVYLGQADNVRNRLQQYGRGGAHLENGCSKDDSTNWGTICAAQRGPRLFTQIFSRGFPVVYRWAPVKTKRDAEIIEDQLLKIFDYAWNKGSNGERRPIDILKKLDQLKTESQFSRMAKKIQYFHQKKEGIKIKAFEPSLLDNESSIFTDMDSNGIFFRIFKFGKTRPILVPEKSCYSDDSKIICGVAMGKGLICTKPPVSGRKRCEEHKGMKVNGIYPKLATEENTPSIYFGINNSPKCHGFEKFSSVCGYILDNGSPCKRQAIRGNKRCPEHKGRRIRLTKGA